MSKYFLHCFLSQPDSPEPIGDVVGACEITAWEISHDSITVTIPRKGDRPERHCMSLRPGNRLYILENHGQCERPNGDIIWRNVDGAQGDERIAA